MIEQPVIKSAYFPILNQLFAAIVVLLKVGTDLFERNKLTYLHIIAYFVRWIEIVRLSTQTSEEVILHSCSMFARHRIPEVVVSDNVPQSLSCTQSSLDIMGSNTLPVYSPYHPQCDGEAERAVKTIKGLLTKSGDHIWHSLHTKAPLWSVDSARLNCS